MRPGNKSTAAISRTFAESSKAEQDNRDFAIGKIGIESLNLYFASRTRIGIAAAEPGKAAIKSTAQKAMSLHIRAIQRRESKTGSKSANSTCTQSRQSRTRQQVFNAKRFASGKMF